MITTINLIKHYDKGLVKALNGVSLTVKKSEIVSIMGPSGCGKSTLLNLIGALDVATAGEILIEGRNIKTCRPYNQFRAQTIGFVFQFHHLIPSLCLLENVELPLYSQPVSKKERGKKAEAILEELGLVHRMNALPEHVSGGERQRTAVARALVNAPKIILADEPTGNLDAETGDMVLECIMRLCHANGATAIIATHNHEIAARTDRAIYIKNGLIEK